MHQINRVKYLNSNFYINFKEEILKNKTFHKKYYDNKGGCTVISGTNIAFFGFGIPVRSYLNQYMNSSGIFERSLRVIYSGAGTFTTTKEALKKFGVIPKLGFSFGREENESGKLLNGDSIRYVLKPVRNSSNNFRAVLLKLEGHAASIVIKNNEIYVSDLIMNHGIVLTGRLEDNYENIINGLLSKTIYKAWYFS